MHIRALPLRHTGYSSGNQDDLDLLGTDLWNLSTRLRREEAIADRTPLYLLRVFAFLLLETAHHAHKGTAQNCVRLLKVALRAVKGCLDCGLLEFAGKVLESAAYFEKSLANPENRITPEDNAIHGRLSGEYYILRTMLVSNIFSRVDMCLTSLLFH
jgi:hypothetical protein